MKIPIVNTDPAVAALVNAAIDRSNGQGEYRRRRSDHFQLEPVKLVRQEQALEYIGYQMPPLVLINFCDADLDGFDLVERIGEDPWMNHGSIVALYRGADTFERLNTLQHSNIIIAVGQEQIERLLPSVLRIIKGNTHILFQRAIHSELISSVTGQFVLGLDLQLVPCYANLLANYLHNMALVDPESKHSVALTLTEMLNNAIEHGNCGIDSEEKARYLGCQHSLDQIIEEKRADPAIRERKVHFRYEIHRDRSRYMIRDEGAGFDWRRYLGAEEIDFLAEHGRGILLARQTADSLGYNELGNEVTLEFRHRPPTANTVPRAFQDNEVVQCSPGDVIFSEGEASSFLYYVAEGEFSVEVGGQQIATLTPEDMLVGEMSFLLEETRSATVIATSPGRLIKISKESFVNIIKDQPYYGLFLSRLLAQRLSRMSRGVVS